MHELLEYVDDVYRDCAFYRAVRAGNEQGDDADSGDMLSDTSAHVLRICAIAFNVNFQSNFAILLKQCLRGKKLLFANGTWLISALINNAITFFVCSNSSRQ